MRESYNAWRRASSDVQRAYEQWATWTLVDRDIGFGGCRAALQLEEYAARVYQYELERAH